MNLLCGLSLGKLLTAGVSHCGILTYHRPNVYALTLSRDDRLVWIMNHDVGALVMYPMTTGELTFSQGNWQRSRELAQHHLGGRGIKSHGRSPWSDQMGA